MSNLARAQQRKGIQTRLVKLKESVKTIDLEIADLQIKCRGGCSQIDRLEKQLVSLQDKGPPTVSEHAIIQYLKLTNFRIESLTKTIMDEKTIALVAELGSGKYPITDTGLKAVVKDNCVVTVIG